MEVNPVVPITSDQSPPSDGYDIRESEVHVTPPEHMSWKSRLLFAGVILGTILIGAGVALGIVWLQRHAHQQTPAKVEIRSYEECINSVGSTLTTTRPLKCTTKDGLEFNEPSELQLQPLDLNSLSSSSGQENSNSASSLPSVENTPVPSSTEPSTKQPLAAPLQPAETSSPSAFPLFQP